MVNKIKSTTIHKTLLQQLVLTDFKLRYQGSILGYFWSLFKPMMMFGVLFVVFTYIIPTGKDVPHFPVYLLLGIVVWTFFVEATTMGLGSIVGRGDLIKKVSIPKISIVISSILSASVNFALNSIIVLLFMAANGVDINWGMLWLVPFLLVELVMLVAGLALFLSALYVRFRDFGPIWEIVLQVMFYATPIIYPLTFALNTNAQIAQILSLSPLAQIIQDLREILVTPVTLTTHDILPGILSYGLPALFISTTLIFGYLYFNKRSRFFVEDL